MTTSSSSQYSFPTTAYPHLNKLLDSLHLPNVLPHSSIFTLPTTAAIVSRHTTPSIGPSLHCCPLLLSLPLLAQDVLATSSHLQQFSAIRQLTRDLQKVKPRHPKRPQLAPSEAGAPTKRIVHTVVYKQNVTQYNDAMKLYERYLNQQLTEQAAELDKNIKNVITLVNHSTPLFKLAKIKSSQYITPKLYSLTVQIPPH